MALTQERIKELFEYMPNGDLIRKVTVSGTAKKGVIAGCLNSDGYLVTMIDSILHYNHRLVWLWHRGYFSENQIDHINMNKADNRIENLREVSRSCNLRNTGNPKNNTSGVKGVSFRDSNKKWHAAICVNRQTYSGGYHKCFEDAVHSRLALEQKFNLEDCDSYSPAFEYIQNNCR